MPGVIVGLALLLAIAGHAPMVAAAGLPALSRRRCTTIAPIKKIARTCVCAQRWATEPFAADTQVRPCAKWVCGSTVARWRCQDGAQVATGVACRRLQALERGGAQWAARGHHCRVEQLCNDGSSRPQRPSTPACRGALSNPPA